MASPTQQETSSSPVPMRKTRIEEKEELAYLNDRFATYIEQVRQMKESNLRLELELQTTKDQLGRESDSVKALYEAELADARNLIDETAKEKARQQIIASKSVSRVEELEAELKTLKDEYEKLESRMSVAERNAASYDAQRKSCLSDKHKLQKQVKDLEAELDELRSTVDALKESLETETLSKVDLQNNIQSLREELAFKRKVYEEELASLRQKLSFSVSGAVEADFSTNLESHLESTIEELRLKSEQEIAQYKQETDAVYRDKISNLEAQSARDVTTITRMTQEIMKLNSNLTTNSDALAKLQKNHDRLEALLRQKEEEISRLRLQHGHEVTQLMEDLRDLRANYELKIKEYQELMDIKVQLDQEIATYRALLQEEENRLNLTPTPREKRTRPRTDQSSEQKTKKARLEQELTQAKQSDSTATGFIQICDVEPSGKYVQIKNMSNQLESLGGFKIHHSVEGGGGEVVFRFHARSKLQAGASVSVWASKAEGAKHNPPSDIVWRAQPNWGAGSKTITRLVSNTGEEMATFTQRSEASPSRSYHATQVQFESIDSAGSRSFPHIPETTVERDSASFTATTSTARVTERQQPLQVGDEHMFHQQGDPRAPGRTERCRIS